MRVEAGRGAMGEERDEFPVGMRVLAVDDDPTCLKVLEAMLRQCKYHVTTSISAIKALKMLRENKDKFDLIITDVHMPDMDGFKLLELVGLDMDLPVIMLSANGDTKVVMKGITHGACDYLLKPVRMEELKNIWQHVLRKKKSAPREHENSDNGHPDVGQGPANSGSSEKVNRKRKDQNEEEEDDSEENTNENDNSNTQKKARVVWSIELHRKFMAAVNHLGVNKAVPKKILDLMNVEGLTRENVASHLQKYRLYLKKVASQNANLALLGVRDPYLPLAALDNFGDFHSFTSSGQLTALPSLQQNGGLSRKDSSIFAHNSIPRGIVQGGCTQNTNDLISELSKLQHMNGNQHGNLLQSVPTTLGLDQLQQQKRVVQEANNRFPGSFPSGGLGNGSSNIPINTVTNSPLALLHTSSGLASMSSGSFEVNAGVSSGLLDTVKCNETWQSAIPLPGAATVVPISSCVSPVVSQINSNPLSFSSSSTVVASQSHPVIGGMTCMLNGTNEDSKYLNFGSVGNIPGQWRADQHDHTPVPNIAFGSSINPLLAGQSTSDPIPHSQRLNNGVHKKRVVTNMNGQTNYGNLFLPQQCKNDKSIADGQLKYKDEYILENSTLQGGLGSNGYNFDELVNMIKPEPQDSLYSWMADMG